MAKKINTEEAPKTDEQVTYANEADTAKCEGITEEQVQTKTEQTAETVAETQEKANPHILELLKKFPAYESLYIDTHDGTYAPNTPAAIRGEAVLYKNPYFNELKKNA